MPHLTRPAARAGLIAAAALCLAGSVHALQTEHRALPAGAGGPLTGSQVMGSQATGGQATGSQATGGQGPGGAMVITTDSDAYCQTLSKAIDAHGSLPREVSDLERQGEDLCGEGKVRSGIVRLRRALLVLRKAAPAGDGGAP